MNTLMLADGTTMRLYREEILTTVENNGTYVKGIKLSICDTNLDTIRNVFKDTEKLSSFSVISETKAFSRTFSGYQFVKTISLDVEASNTYGTDVFEITLGMTSDIKELIESWTKRLDQNDENTENVKKLIDETGKAIDDLGSNLTKMNESVDKTTEQFDIKISDINKAMNDVQTQMRPRTIDDMTLPEAIETRVSETKLCLSIFLSSHPLFSTCHNKDGEYYSVTSEKQQYLLSMINIAEAAKASGVEYTPSWNAQGKSCTYDWTIDQLKELALEIANYVRPLVSKQQKMEVELRAMTDIDSVKAYEISFD